MPTLTCICVNSFQIPDNNAASNNNSQNYFAACGVCMVFEELYNKKKNEHSSLKEKWNSHISFFWENIAKPEIEEKGQNHNVYIILFKMFLNVKRNKKVMHFTCVLRKHDHKQYLMSWCEGNVIESHHLNVVEVAKMQTTFQVFRS